jgi:hypothetical protein
MASRSMTRRQLSRTKIELFLECQRCFFDDVAGGYARPSGPPFTLNIAVDALLKAEFDTYRAKQSPHPLFASVALEAVPLRDARLDDWRENFKGVRWFDAATGWTFFGAVDDLWLKPDGSVIVADYKATAKAEEVTAANVHPAYPRQLAMYQFLVERQGFSVDTTGWLVYANGIKTRSEFADALTFRTAMIPVACDRAWVEGAFRSAVALVESGVRPEPAADCKWCAYVEGRR